MAGRVLGTTDYVSPEQALGQPVTGQSDLYSLGVVLYEMLTGDVPFHGESPVAVAMKHVREEVPDVQLRRPQLSAATAAVRRPRDRQGPRPCATPTRASMVADLEEALAIEASRSGQATGEVTTRAAHAARTARRRAALAHAPSRRAGSPRWRCSRRIVAIALGAARRVTPTAAPASPPVNARRRACSRSRSRRPRPTTTTRSAPGRKTATRSTNVVDSDPNTTWSTEQYYDGTLQASRAGSASASTSTPPRR